MTFAYITVSGTISKNAEQRFTPNNNSVVNFTIKVLRYDGKSKEEKSYPIRITIWGDSQAENLNRMVTGARVIVSGRLQLEQFTDKKGKSIRLASIEANKLDFVEDLAQVSSNISSNQDLEMITEEMASEEIPF